ncbi:MAG: bifunctional hydroxymethylpyrimidine kinase/phosphomethylpyrimidine kinase [Deltaproteobacteria bacterium]|jgi:hydroxymethylpyrimidine/phosphomethylpyrimidine kinase|nr:bifunctional hydroxymethylpyrimidine kinase/phosphomethylpyrimidine kinase [Deltaproteobacteria bacterium]
MSKKVVLAIGGSDPSGGAGIQADLATFMDHGVSGIFAVTAVTAQNDEELLAIHPTPADILTQQISTACKNNDVGAAKIGMIATMANTQAITWFLRRAKLQHVVVDPVLHSSSGASLLEADAYSFYRQRLLPFASVITPNLSEASALAGMQVASLETMRTAAEVIHREASRLKGPLKGDLAVVVKGGHLDGDAVDVLFDGKEYHSFTEKRVSGRSPRGTGCRFASAIAANLANGKEIVEAVSDAKDYLTEYIQKSDQ